LLEKVRFEFQNGHVLWKAFLTSITAVGVKYVQFFH